MSKPDPLNYGKTNANYWQEKYGPGLFDKYQGATKHANLSQPTKPKPRPAPLPLKPEIAGDVMIVRMPLPPKELSPNGRAAWQRKAEFTKAARNAVAMQVRSVVTKAWLGCSVRLDVRRWADKRMDNDNCWAALKAHRDGVADGLMTTDAQFELGDIQQIIGKLSEGRREVELTITRQP